VISSGFRSLTEFAHHAAIEKAREEVHGFSRADELTQKLVLDLTRITTSLFERVAERKLNSAADVQTIYDNHLLMSDYLYAKHLVDREAKRLLLEQAAQGLSGITTMQEIEERAKAIAQSAKEND
jgi:hypothetical protein